MPTECRARRPGLHPLSVAGTRIAEDAEYHGVRVLFRAELDSARILLQTDVGFGDAVVPGPVMTKYPTILELPAPRLRGYTRESVIAEKFHTMVRRGRLNSRMRDFFDVAVLSRQFDFDGAVLASAIRETFARRDLEIDPSPVALSEDFTSDAAKIAQWRGFLRTGRLDDIALDLDDAVAAIALLIAPVVEALHDGCDFNGIWRAPGPWSSA